MFYVYVFLDPRKPGSYRYGKWTFTYEPFYVGKGKDGRIWQHFLPASLKGNSYKCRKMRSIMRETGDLPPHVIKKRGLTEEQAFWYEAKLIQDIGRGKYGPLTNLTDGGEGTSGAIRSKQWKQIHIAQNQQRWKDEEFKERVGINISKAHANRTTKQRAETLKRVQDTWNNMSDRKKRQISKTMSEGQKCYLRTASKEELALKGKKTSAGLHRYYADLDSESKEYRSNCLKKAHAKRSTRRKKQINSAISSSVKARHASRTSEEKRLVSNAIKESMARPESRQRRSVMTTVQNKLRKLGLWHSEVHYLLRDKLKAFVFDGTDQAFKASMRMVDRELCLYT